MGFLLSLIFSFTDTYTHKLTKIFTKLITITQNSLCHYLCNVNFTSKIISYEGKLKYFKSFPGTLKHFQSTLSHILIFNIMLQGSISFLSLFLCNLTNRKTFFPRLFLLIRQVEIYACIHFYIQFHGVPKIYPGISDQRVPFLRR